METVSKTNMVVDIADSARMACRQSQGRQDKARSVADIGQAVDRTPGADDRPACDEESFARVYRKVAEANRSAQKAAEGQGRPAGGDEQGDGGCVDQVKAKSADVPQDAGQVVAEAETVIEEALKEVAAGEKSGDGEALLTVAEQAAAMLRQALQTISQTLHLNITEGLGELTAIKPSEGVIEQFSEIVYALKQIAALLANGLSEGFPVEFGGKQLTAEQIAQAEKLIRVEVFHMEVAFKMLGVSREVAGGVAARQNLPFDFGLVQAVDPAVKTMSEDQVRQAFGELIAVREKELRELFGRVVDVLRSSGKSETPSPSALLQLAKSQQATLNVGAFDSMIMRKILKLDVSAASAESNVEAAGKAARIDLAKLGSVPIGKPAAEIAPQTDASSVVPMLEALGRERGMESLGTMLGQRLTTLLQRNVEESVMNQIVTRVQQVARAGLSEMRLVLHPDSLGEVRIKIDVHQDVVFTRIHVESMQVKQIVESNLQQLRDALAQHNLTAGSFEVNVGAGSRREAGEPGENEDRRDGEERGDGNPGVEGVQSENGVALGRDTGRRYGNNTLEFFA